MKTRLEKWGNSLAVRIPKRIADRAEFHLGDSLELAVPRPGTVELRRRGCGQSLAQLVRRITPQNRHKEISWGPAQGREIQ